MRLLLFSLMVAGFIPWLQAWRANRKTTLYSTIAWALAAWSMWTWLTWEDWQNETSDHPAIRYIALSITASAGVGVLGARRPGVGAWNFVLLGLLAVLLLPIAEGLGTPRLHGHHLFFLGAILAITILNYMPTRLGCAALLAGAAIIGQFARLIEPSSHNTMWSLCDCCLPLIPWVGWAALRFRRRPTMELDCQWLSFRDSYGGLWAERVRQQFNRAAANADWPIHLRWHGLEQTTSASVANSTSALAALQALLKRFDRADPGDQ